MDQYQMPNKIDQILAELELYPELRGIGDKILAFINQEKALSFKEGRASMMEDTFIKIQKEIDELKVRVQYLELRQPPIQYIQTPCPYPHYPSSPTVPFQPLLIN